MVLMKMYCFIKKNNKILLLLSLLGITTSSLGCDCLKKLLGFSSDSRQEEVEMPQARDLSLEKELEKARVKYFQNRKKDRTDLAREMVQAAMRVERQKGGQWALLTDEIDVTKEIAGGNVVVASVRCVEELDGADTASYGYVYVGRSTAKILSAEQGDALFKFAV
jgi:hypothetical protein